MSSVLHCFRWDLWNVSSSLSCSFCDFKHFDFYVSWYILIPFFLLLGFFEILDLWLYSVYQIWKIFSHYFFKYFLSSTLGTPVRHLLGWLKLIPHITDKQLCSFSFIFPSSLFWVISISVVRYTDLFYLPCLSLTCLCLTVLSRTYM